MRRRVGSTSLMRGKRSISPYFAGVAGRASVNAALRVVLDAAKAVAKKRKRTAA
jgi:hypothetical protein